MATRWEPRGELRGYQNRMGHIYEVDETAACFASAPDIDLM